MVTIRNNSIELEDGDTISVDGTELTFRSSGELEFPDGETAISLSDIDGADIAPNSVDAVTDVTTSNVTTDALKADAATIANRQVSNVLGAHDTRIEELLLNQGLGSLDFDGGFVEIYANQDRVDSSTNIEGFNGSISLTDGKTAGSLTTVFETLGFVPNSVVLNQTADVRQDVVAENGEQFEYAVSDGANVSDVSLELTGRDSTNNESQSWSGLESQDNVQFEIQGSTSTDLEVTFNGIGASAGFDQYAGIGRGISHAYSDTGDEIAVADGFTIRVHSTDDYTSNRDLSQSSSLDAIDWSGDYISYAETSGSTAKVINSSDGSVVYSVSDSGGSGSLNPYQTTVTDSGELAYSIGYDEETYVYDSSGNLETTLTEPTYHTNANRWSPSGDRLAVGDRDGNVWLYDKTDWSYDQLTISDSVTSLAWSPDGSKLAVGHGDGGVVIFNISTGGEITTISGSGYDTYVGFSPSGDYVGFAARDSGADVVVSKTSDWSVLYDKNHPLDGGGTSRSPGLLSFGNGKMSISAASAGGVHLWNVTSPTTDPSLNVDGNTASYDGKLGSGESETATLNGVSKGSYSVSPSLSAGSVDLDLSWTETTETNDPSVKISSADGSQTVKRTGVLADGETANLNNEIDESRIGGDVTVSVNVSEGVTGPVGQVGLEYRHEGMDAGGIINYTIEDGDGNSKKLPIDTETDISSFTSEDVRLLIDVFNGLANVTSSGFGIYLDGGN